MLRRGQELLNPGASNLLQCRTTNTPNNNNSTTSTWPSVATTTVAATDNTTNNDKQRHRKYNFYLFLSTSRFVVQLLVVLLWPWPSSALRQLPCVDVLLFACCRIICLLCCPQYHVIVGVAFWSLFCCATVEW